MRPHFHEEARLTMLFLETVDKARRNVCLIANLLRVVPGFELFVSTHKNPNYQIQTYFWDRQLLALVVEISAKLEIFFHEIGTQFRGHLPHFACKHFKLLLSVLGTKFGPEIGTEN